MTAASITDEDGRILQWGICEDASPIPSDVHGEDPHFSVQPDTAIPPGGSGTASPLVAPVAGGLAQTPAAAPLPPGAAAGPCPAGDVTGIAASPAGTTGLRGDAFLKAVRAEQSRQNAARRSGRGRYTRKADRPLGSGYAPGGNRTMPDGGKP